MQVDKGVTNMKSKARMVMRIAAFIIGILILITMAAFIVLQIRTDAILDDYSSIYNNEKYMQAVFIEDIDVIKQNISCGYAVLEMFSSWDGQEITEESLYSEYGKVVTSTGQTFCNEMNKQFSAYQTTMYKYLGSAELIDKIYDNLSRGIPVPIEWAALYENEWTLHYSLVTGIDIPNDRIVAANPYGYYEELSIEDFLDRTSFEAYTNMPFYLRLAFAFGIFEKNTVFCVE